MGNHITKAGDVHPTHNYFDMATYIKHKIILQIQCRWRSINQVKRIYDLSNHERICLIDYLYIYVCRLCCKLKIFLLLLTNNA